MLKVRICILIALVAQTIFIAKAADYTVPPGVTVLNEEQLLNQAIGNTFFNERWAEYWEPPTGDQKKGNTKGKHVRGDYSGSWEIKDALICFQFDAAFLAAYNGICYTIAIDSGNATWYNIDGSTYYPRGGRIKLVSGNPKNL